MILGKNITIPTKIDTIADTNTAPAAISFASFAFSFLSGIAKSTVTSIAVFNNSAVITKPKSKKHIAHSVKFILSTTPNIIAKTVTIKCIFKFCSVFKALPDSLNCVFKTIL